MNYRRAKTVYVKELVDILRDRRTLIAMILVPIVLYPLIMLGGVQAVSGQASDVEDVKMVIGVERTADWHNVILPLILQERRMLKRMRADALAGGAGPEELAQIPTPLHKYLAEPQVTDKLDDAVRQHKVHCGVIVEDPGWMSDPGTANPVVLRFKFQPEDYFGEYTAQRLQEALERVAQRRTQRQLQMLNIDPRVVKPIIIEAEHLTTSGSVLGLIVPLILVLMTISGAIYPAIDLTAGERERGTLESLMVCPVPVIDLIVGKFLVVTTISIAGAALNLASMTATVYFGGIEQALGGTDSDGGGFPIYALPIILLSLIPFAVFMSAIMIAVCSYARTFKEAQNYVTPLIIMVVVAGGIAAFPGAKLQGTMMVTPVANMVLLTRELLSGAHIAPSTFAWVILSTTFYAAAAVGIAAQIFGRESVVFADSISLGSLFSRRMIKPSRLPSLTSVGLYTAVLFPVWFHVQGLLQLAGDADMGKVLVGTAILMPVFFVGMPMAILKWCRVNTTAAFTFATPQLRYLAAAVLIGLSAWVPAHEIFVFQEHYLGSPPGIGEMNKALIGALHALPIGVVFLVIAIIPAFCEELFFRGFLLNGLRPSMRGWTAIVCCGVAFGIFHFFIFKFVATALMGIVLGWLCWRSRSIWPAILAHALHNGVLVVSVLWPNWHARLGIGADDPWAHLPLAVLMTGIGLFLVGLLLIGSSAPARLPATAPPLKVED